MELPPAQKVIGVVGIKTKKASGWTLLTVVREKSGNFEETHFPHRILPACWQTQLEIRDPELTPRSITSEIWPSLELKAQLA